MFKTILGTSIAFTLAATCLPALSAEGSSEQFPVAQNLDFTNLPGADQNANGAAAAPAAADSYLFVAGSAFTPRTSSQTVMYPGGGCSYSDSALTTSLELPNNAMIQGVRLYYYSAIASSKVGLFLTTYPGDGTSSDLLVANSTSGTGYTSEYFSATPPLTVNNFTASYVLTATTAPNTRFCGMRVFYGQ